MRYAIVFVLLVAVAFASEWVYRSFLRPIDQPTGEMVALERHMNKKGIKVSLYPVRHGFSHSSVTAHAAFAIENFPLPVSVSQSPSETAAELHLQAIQRGPNLMFPARNGRLVIFFPMWGDDATAEANRFTTEFKAFKE
jgi:hypothetical protein